MRKSFAGFTLVELLTVVLVIGILTAIAVPSYRSYVVRSQRTAARTALLNLQAAQEKFFLQNHRYSGNVTAAMADGGLGLQGVSDGGYYTIGIMLSNAEGTGYTATATPTAGSGQAQDTKCSVFSIDQNGKRAAQQSDSSDNTIYCWK